MGQAELVDFPDERSLPKYAILSHTWAEEEVLLHDLVLGPNHEVTPSAASRRASRPHPNTQPLQRGTGNDAFDATDSESEEFDNLGSEATDSDGEGATWRQQSLQSGHKESTRYVLNPRGSSLASN